MYKKLFAIAASVLCLASCGAKQQAGEIGLQLYSIRDVIGSPEQYDANHATAFAKLSEMGYKTIEMYGYSDGTFFGHTPLEVKSDLEAAGLRALSTHTVRNLSAEELEAGAPSEETIAWWTKCIADHKSMGCEYIVAPSFNIPHTLKDLQTYCDYFNTVGQMCAEQGLTFGYHNHSHKFKKKVEGEVVYDYMLAHTDPQYVFFELDVYWAIMAQQYPVELFKANAGRFHLLHIKDHAELGESGMVGFDSIFKNASVGGAQHYFVELEFSLVGDILESCALSAQYLQDNNYYL